MEPDGVWIRAATTADAEAVAALAGELAQSYPFSRTAFDASFAAVLEHDDACLLLAGPDDAAGAVGYLLGSAHRTFYANGPVASVEEILVRQPHRGRGVGRALMGAFERWAAGRGCRLVTLATRRAVPFYRALGYEESAMYLRRTLGDG